MKKSKIEVRELMHTNAKTSQCNHYIYKRRKQGRPRGSNDTGRVFNDSFTCKTHEFSSIKQQEESKEEKTQRTTREPNQVPLHACFI